MEKLYITQDLIFLKCLGIADVSKLGYMLLIYIQSQFLYSNKKNYTMSIKYNQNKIDKECFGGKSNNSTSRALKNLCEKNILIYNPESRKIKINFNVETWYVSNEQYQRILEAKNDNKMYKNGQ
jgi:uncharacterized membrane-anchored protein